MFIGTLFTIAREWKQPKCPSMEEWIIKIWYVNTMKYYSAAKKNKQEKLDANRWTRKDYAELTQTQKDKHLMFSLT